MKTNTQNQNEEAREQIRTVEQSNTQTQTAAAQAQPDKKDNRLPIDSEARKANRSLPTPKVLSLLHQHLPAAYRLAEVVGKWVWVTFKEQPSAEIRQQLAQFGFHWNRERQAWQHPCGKFSLGSQADPHEKYSSYHPARIRRAAKQQPTQATAAAAYVASQPACDRHCEVNLVSAWNTFRPTPIGHSRFFSTPRMQINQNSQGAVKNLET